MPNTQTNAGRSRIKSSSTIRESWGDRVFITVVYFMSDSGADCRAVSLDIYCEFFAQQPCCRLLGKSLVVAH